MLLRRPSGAFQGGVVYNAKGMCSISPDLDVFTGRYVCASAWAAGGHSCLAGRCSILLSSVDVGAFGSPLADAVWPHAQSY